jgi:DNA-binding LacI/PurR family transcriptional regulator
MAVELTVISPQPRPRGATLEEVARLAGVSRATVSRVVNGSPRVSDDVRRSVEAAVGQLGYVPNRAARSLVTRRSGSIAVVITEPTGRLFSDPFFPRVLRGVSATVSARDLQVVLLLPDSVTDSRRTADYLVAGHVDGAVLVSLHGDDPLPGRIVAAQIPLVVVGRPLHASGISYVDVDNRGGARSAVADLVAGGRRVIAAIGGPADMIAAQDRRNGYRDAITEAGLVVDPTLEASADFTQAGGIDAMERLFAARPDIDAVFAASDLMAAGAMSVLDAEGRRVPDDVAIIGYDDSPVAATARPPLTSVRQPIEEMGQEAARLLLELVEGADRAPRRVILSTELIRRASSARRAMP